MITYKLTIAYDGGAYHGWQVQPNGITVQEVIQGILSQVLQEAVHIVGSGRTDAGVHAEGQVAHFRTETSVDCEALLCSLNALLPKDIRILALEDAPEAFHARYSATGKIYHYRVTTGSFQSPFERRRALHTSRQFNLESLRQAIPSLLGTHDFTAFANSPTQGSVANNPIRTIHRIDLVETPSGFRLEFEGNGFLYKMVRNLVGTLVEVGLGKREPGEIKEILLSKDRRRAGRAALPHGLSLVKVFYT